MTPHSGRSLAASVPGAPDDALEFTAMDPLLEIDREGRER
jgi:hypothetical protein